jgi:simple sugar transport system ATP-binding protein
VRGLDLELRPGSITGIAGVRESGLETLELALAGFLPLDEGELTVFGARVDGRGPRAVREAGSVFVPGDRMGVALAPRLPLWINAAVHEGYRARGFLDFRRLHHHVGAIMALARVSGSPRDPAAAFSGGTLQRVILARELSENPRILLLAEPGWGLDEASRAELDARLLRAAADGAAIALFSTDLDELLALSDEILVLRDGLIVERFENRTAAGESLDEELRERIGAAMIGAGVCRDA